MIFYLFTKGGSPLTINMKYYNDEIHYEVQINLRLLDEFRKDTDTILFIDLIKKMVHKDPEGRETCENLINHAVFMNIEYRCTIVRDISRKCVDKDNIIKILNRNEVHMEGSLEKESDVWKDFLNEISKCTPPSIDFKVCSNLVQLFRSQVNIKNYSLLNIFGLFVITFITD